MTSPDHPTRGARAVKLAVVRDLAAVPPVDLPLDIEPTQPERFGDEVLRYLEEWLDENGDTPFQRSDRAVFVLSPHPHSDSQVLPGLEDVEMFSHDHDHRIAGDLHLCSWGLHDVLRCPLPGTSARLVARALREAGVGDRAAIFFYPGQRRAYFYPKGAAFPGERVEFRFEARAAIITADVIEDELESFYRCALRVPQRIPRIWQRGRPMRPVEEPEKEMQETLYILLRHSFRGSARIGREYVQESGRADFIVEPRRREEGEVCVIELKVLRSHWSTGRQCTPAQTEAAVREVITQAADYRDEADADHAFACCYDMRTRDEDAIRIQFEPEAEARSVRLRRWYLHRSHSVARELRAFGSLRKLKPRRRDRP